MQVRYAAQMTSGEGFYAHDEGYTITEAPGLKKKFQASRDADGIIILDDVLGEGRQLQDADPTELFWFMPKARRIRPTANDYLYIVTRESATELHAYGIIKMATDIGDDQILIGTEHELHNVLWGGKVVDYVYDANYYANAEATV